MERHPLRSLGWVLIGLALLIVIIPTAYYLHLKRIAAQAAQVQSVDWNPSHTCDITTYIPSLGEESPRSRFFYLFSSDAFFRVHDSRGNLLRSSEWLLFQNEANDEVPRWASDGQVVYPTHKGYEGWHVPECSRP